MEEEDGRNVGVEVKYMGGGGGMSYDASMGSNPTYHAFAYICYSRALTIRKFSMFDKEEDQ
jgi:hypothetical protein